MTTLKQVVEFMERENIDYISTDQDYPEFRYSGCECCADRLGNDVYLCRSYSKDNGDTEYWICGDCLYKMTYGEE